MSIIFINRFFYPDNSATSQLLSDLAFDLARDNFKVKIITSGNYYRTRGSCLPKRDFINGVSVFRVPTFGVDSNALISRIFQYLIFYIGAAFLLLRTIHRGDVVVFKTDPPLISAFLGPIAKIRGAYVVNWVQDIFPEVATRLGFNLIGGLLTNLLRWVRNKSLYSAEMNVILGSRMKDFLLAEGVPPECMSVIPNWVDGSDIYPIPPSDNRLRKDWGLSTQLVIGYSGNLGRAHDFETILNAARLLKNNPRITFLFIGGGAQMELLKKKVTEQELINFQFHSYQSRQDLRESLNAADIHLVALNPLLEGLIVPSKIYGILAAGRPTIFIGDPDGEISRIIKLGSCGYSVSIGNSQLLAKIIEALEGDRRCSNNLGLNGRKFFESNYDRKASYALWKNILKNYSD